jgi:hypothetical protein
MARVDGRIMAEAMHKRIFWLTGLLVGAALIVAACGGGGDDSADDVGDDSTPPSATEPDATDPADDTPETPDEPTEPETPDTPAEPVDDPDREVLVYGETFNASISEVDGFRQFRFEGVEGDLVRVRVDGKAGMDPIVVLQEPARIDIATNDDMSLTNRDSVIVATLPSSGLQVIRVTEFGGGVGDFAITVELLPLDDDDESGLITIGDTVSGVLGLPDDFDVFEFPGDEGQAVTVTVDGLIGVDVLAQIFDPDGFFVTFDDDGGHGLDAEIRLTLPKSGTYRLEVAVVSGKMGGYTVSVLPQTERVAAAADVAQAMEAVSLTYLDALQQGDALTIFALAGPEALNIWGWESADEVSTYIQKLQSIGVIGVAGASTSTVAGDRGRTTVAFDTTGSDIDEELRFDLINVNGVWLVDFVQRVFNPDSA